VVFGEPKAGNISSLSYSATGQTLAAACADGVVHLWNTTLAKPVQRAKLEGHAGAVTGVMYAHDNKLIVTGSADWTVRTWDITGPAPKERFVPASHISHVYSSALSPDCHTLASGSLDRVLRLWDLNRTEPKTRTLIKGESIPIHLVAFSPDGTRLACSGTSTTIRQYDPASGKQLRPCTGMPHYPASLAYSPDGKALLSHYDKDMFLYEAATGDLTRQLSGHTAIIYSVAFSPNGKQILSSSGNYLYKDGKIVEIDKVPQYIDCTVRLWDAEMGTETACVKSHKLPVYRAFFSPDGKYFYAGGSEPTVVRRETAKPDKEETPAFPGLTPLHHTFQFSPDGTRLLAIGSGYRLVLLDMATGKPVWDTNFAEQIGHVTFASDSRHLVVSLATGVIYIVRLAAPTLK